MLIDAVLARNEVDLVQLRAKYLEGFVDRMVICESPKTFAGEDKPLLFSELLKNGALPTWVEVFVIELPESITATKSHMAIEDYVRWEFLERLNRTYPHARVLYQDVDEFPSHEQLENARTIEPRENVISIPMQIFYRRLNWKLLRKGDRWLCAKLITGMPEKQNIRSIRSRQHLHGELGAHFSFLEATPGGLRDKLRHYPHQDVNIPAIWSEKYITFCDHFGLDHLGRAIDPGMGLLGFVPKSRFTSTMTFAARVHPDWVGENFNRNLPIRLLAAQIGRKFVMSDGDLDFIRSSGKSITPLGMLFSSGTLAMAILELSRRNVIKSGKRLLNRLRRLIVGGSRVTTQR